MCDPSEFEVDWQSIALIGQLTNVVSPLTYWAFFEIESEIRSESDQNRKSCPHQSQLHSRDYKWKKISQKLS